jgi:hypothetical protein
MLGSKGDTLALFGVRFHLLPSLTGAGIFANYFEVS